MSKKQAERRQLVEESQERVEEEARNEPKENQDPRTDHDQKNQDQVSDENTSEAPTHHDNSSKVGEDVEVEEDEEEYYEDEVVDKKPWGSRSRSAIDLEKANLEVQFLQLLDQLTIKFQQLQTKEEKIQFIEKLKSILSDFSHTEDSEMEDVPNANGFL